MTKRTFNHLTFTDRLRIEEGKRHGLTAKQIADELGVHFSTIYRELKRGTYQHMQRKTNAQSFIIVTRTQAVNAERMSA